MVNPMLETGHEIHSQLARKASGLNVIASSLYECFLTACSFGLHGFAGIL